MSAGACLVAAAALFFVPWLLMPGVGVALASRARERGGDPSRADRGAT